MTNLGQQRSKYQIQIPFSLCISPRRQTRRPTRVLELIKELARYEKAPEQVTNSLELMKEDGFGPNPVYGFYVCEKNETDEIIGIAIYYYRYSTWKGKRLYLEDIVVTESERGNGAGKLLFDRVMAKSLETNCTG